MSSKGMPNLRTLVITEKAVYNLPVSDYSTLKRRILIEHISSATASKISSEVVLHVPSEYDFRFQIFDKEEMLTALTFLKKKQGVDNFRIKWVYDFFLGDYAMTRENALAGSPAPAATPPDPSKERARQYVNKLKASMDNGQSAIDEEGDEDDVDNTTEDAEQIDVNGSKKVSLADFDLLRVLGRGAFGKVVQVRKKDSGELFAMKILKKAMIYKRKQLAHTLAERRILEAATHPFCVCLKFAFQNEAKLYFVMDFCTGGELYYHLKKQKHKRFDESIAKIIGAEIVLGLGHLHANRFIYRDLKPENVLMHGDGHICLSDFGLAKELDPDVNDTRTMCGTPEYLGKFAFCGKRLMFCSRSTGSSYWEKAWYSN
eukprot:TRINITY_DN4813_c0_g1_i1.p1 TRINITY_DN4813_c0_g1~~TRINITY_DN4813_c0_g1_i1.p1  ORF type:complete len:437 (-),score=109.88 TRINITY_DN4813_c0_g1_i1:1449-2567(-)